MTFATPAYKAKWLLDVSGGDGLIAFEIGIHRGFLGDGTLELIVEKTKLSDDCIRVLLLQEFSSSANSIFPVIIDQCIQRLWTIDFQIQHLLRVCHHIRKEPLDVALRSSIYNFQILDKLLLLGYFTVSDSTIHYLVATDNFKCLQWYLNNCLRRGYDNVSLKLVQLAVKYSEPRIVSVLLNHLDESELGEAYDVLCRQLAMEREDLEIIRVLLKKCTRFNDCNICS